MSAIKHSEEEQEGFFLLDSENPLWPWLVGGFVFLLTVIFLTGYING
jgi:hypothetical protein